MSERREGDVHRAIEARTTYGPAGAVDGRETFDLNLGARTIRIVPPLRRPVAAAVPLALPSAFPFRILVSQIAAIAIAIDDGVRDGIRYRGVVIGRLVRSLANGTDRPAEIAAGPLIAMHFWRAGRRRVVRSLRT